MRKLPIIKKGYTGDLQFSYQDSQHTPFLLFFAFSASIFILLFLLVCRLFQLTVVKGTYYRRLADENRIRELVIEPKRGTIIDRTGTVIAQNEDADVNSLAEHINSKRIYSFGDEIGHIIGYRQSADEKDFNTDNCLYKLKSGDRVGKKGIEKLLECDLRGISGKKLVEFDARGKLLRTLNVVPPQDGKTIQLALDMNLQAKAFSLLKGKKGSIVALKPQTGEIIVIASNPSFNPQDFEDSNSKTIQRYFTDSSKPLFNRAAEATYPPGSVFKMVIGAGALEEKKIQESTTIEDTGIIKAGQASFGNWYFLQYGKKEGPVNITKAIRRSNDIFFYKIGESIGPEKIKSWAEKFGYGTTTGFGLDEANGTLPSPFWKEEVLKEKWYLGDTYNYSIGQGYVLTTPLQVAQATTVWANSGYLCKPRLLKVPNGQIHPVKDTCTKLPLSEKTISLIRGGMKEACSTGGTGWPFFDFKPQVGCKTGTAESHSSSGEPHAWFTVFAPYDNPEIVVTVMIEEGGQGSDIAAPVAKEILKTYFGETK